MGQTREHEVVRVAIVSSIERILHDVSAVRSGLDPEGVHQARVAIRRLRSNLRTFRDLLDETRIVDLDRRLRALGSALGTVRDLDVLLEALAANDADAELVAHFAAQRRRAGTDLGAVLDDPATTALLGALTALAADPPVAAPYDDATGERLTALVHKRWRALDEAMGTLSSTSTPRELHRARILAKRCRYAAEDVHTAFARARRFAKALASLQDALGRLHDVNVATERLQEAAHEVPTLAFAAGEVAGRFQARAGADHDVWQRAWKRASKPKHRSWM